MIYAVVWLLCGLLALSFLWEVVRMTAVPVICTLLVGAVAAVALYYGVRHGMDVLCAYPWAADAVVWATAPASVLVIWATARHRRRAA